MVLDSSAIVAILLTEPEADALMAAVAADPVRLLGAVTLLEGNRRLRGTLRAS